MLIKGATGVRISPMCFSKTGMFCLALSSLSTVSYRVVSKKHGMLLELSDRSEIRQTTFYWVVKKKPVHDRIFYVAM